MVEYQRPKDPIFALVVFAVGFIWAISSAILLMASALPGLGLNWQTWLINLFVGTVLAIFAIWLPQILENKRMPTRHSNSAHRSY